MWVFPEKLLFSNWSSMRSFFLSLLFIFKMNFRWFATGFFNPAGFFLLFFFNKKRKHVTLCSKDKSSLQTVDVASQNYQFTKEHGFESKHTRTKRRLESWIMWTLKMDASILGSCGFQTSLLLLPPLQEQNHDQIYRATSAFVRLPGCRVVC